MTTLLITPKVENKTAKFKGTIAAGEHVAVTIKDGAEWSAEGLMLRVIDLTTQRTLAVFPRPEETLAEGETPDAWDTNAGDLTCTLNLNTTRMVAAARHMIRVPVLFVLGNSSEDERTLYFRDCYEVELWPERIGDDTPYDLDKWPKQIDEWTEQMEDWARQMQAFNTALSEEAEARANGDAPLAGQTINTNTTNAMRQAIKTIGAALGATMRVLAVCAALPLLGATVQTAPLGELDLNTNPRVVTNVTFEGLLTEHQDITGKADKTNTYTKAQTDAQIDAVAAGLAPTNHSHEIITDGTNTITAAREFFGPSGSMATNYVNDIYGTLQLESYDAENQVVSYGSEEVQLFCMGGYWHLFRFGDESTISCSGYGMDAQVVTATTEPPLVFTRQIVERTAFIGRLALTNDIPNVSMDVSRTTDTSVLLNDPELPSARLVPDETPSAYWPNRQRVLRLGDEDSVISMDRTETKLLLVDDPAHLVFVESATVDGNGNTNYTLKTFRQYLNAVSPDTLQETLRAYLPTEGGGSVTGNVEMVGDLLVQGKFEAPNLVRVVTADIEANGFSVSNGVLRANSGLMVSNGMCRINCARAVLGIGTPRLHMETVDPLSHITFGGTWDQPYGNLTDAISITVQNNIVNAVPTFDQAKSYAYLPTNTPPFTTGTYLSQDVVSHTPPVGLVTLRNWKTNVLTDSQYNAYVVLQLDSNDLPLDKFECDILFRYTSSVPSFYFHFGTFGDAPTFYGQTDAFSPTAGTVRRVHMKHIGNDEWIVTYQDLTSWSPPMNMTFPSEEP